MKHRAEHKEKKLTDNFPAVSNYYMTKIFEATHNESKFPLGAAHVELIADCVNGYREDLIERGKWDLSDGAGYDYDLIQYPLEQLRDYFAQSSSLSAKDAYIYTSFVELKFKVLK